MKFILYDCNPMMKILMLSTQLKAWLLMWNSLCISILNPCGWFQINLQFAH